MPCSRSRTARRRNCVQSRCAPARWRACADHDARAGRAGHRRPRARCCWTAACVAAPTCCRRSHSARVPCCGPAGAVGADARRRRWGARGAPADSRRARSGDGARAGARLGARDVTRELTASPGGTDATGSRKSVAPVISGSFTTTVDRYPAAVVAPANRHEQRRHENSVIGVDSASPPITASASGFCMLAAGAEAERERQQAEQRAQRRHEDRAQPDRAPPRAAPARAPRPRRACGAA